MGACACSRDNGINITPDVTSYLHLGRSQEFPPGHFGKTVRAQLGVTFPNPLVGIIWEYARELEVCFPPKGRPLAARYIDPKRGRTSSSDSGDTPHPGYFDYDNMWNMPEISCSLMSLANHLYCQLMVRNPRVMGYGAITVWQGPLIKYDMISDRKYFESNVALQALQCNSTIFARPWRSFWESKIADHEAMRGSEHMLPVILDGMHELWMLDMTRQW